MLDSSKYRDLSAIGVILAAVFYIFASRDFMSSDLSIANLDNLHVVYPFFASLIESLEKFNGIELWNSKIWGGMPAIGNPNIPFNVFLYAFLYFGKSGFVLAMNWHMFFEFFFAAVGMYFLLGHILRSKVLSLAGALFYVFSTSATALFAFYSTFFHFTIVPWVLLAILNANRWPLRNTIPFVAVLIYLQITYGQLQMTIYSFELYALAAVWLFKDRIRFQQGLACLLPGLVLGVLLSSHFVLPLLDVLSYFNDRAGGELKSYVNAYRVAYHYIVNLFFSDLYWGGHSWWPVQGSGASVWESFVVNSGMFMSLLWLFSLKYFWSCEGDWRQLLARRLNIVALIIVFIVVNKVGAYLGIYLSGGSRVPFGRLTHMLLFVMLTNGGIVAEDLLRQKKALRQFAIFCMVFTLGLFVFSSEPVLYSYVQSFFDRAFNDPAKFEAFWPANKSSLQEIIQQKAFIVLVWTFLLAMSYWLFNKMVLRRALFFVTLGSSLAMAADYQQRTMLTTSAKKPFDSVLSSSNPLVSYLHENLGEGMHNVHVVTGVREKDSGLTPNQNAIHGIPSVNGYTSINPRRSPFEPEIFRSNFGEYVFPGHLRHLTSVKYVLSNIERPIVDDEIKSYPIISEWQGFRLQEAPNPTARYYFPKSVQSLTSEERAVKIIAQEDFDPKQISYVVENSELAGQSNSCMPRLLSKQETLNKTSLQIENNCEDSRVLAMNTHSYRWWKYSLNGSDVQPFTINVLHKGLVLAPGKHQVEIRVEATSFKWGLWLSWLTLLAIVLLRIVVRRPILP